MRRLVPVAVLVFAVVMSAEALAAPILVFSTDFSAGAPAEFSGAGSTESVQGYAGIGGFENNFLRNVTAPPQATTLTLMGLPAHTHVDIDFLLAIIDSWDGNTNPAFPFTVPDVFNVTVDGAPVFSHTFDNFDMTDQSYAPPAGGLLTSGSNLGFSRFPDSGYDMSVEPTLGMIPHNSDTLLISWFASGAGWQGLDDESWAIDNVSIFVEPVVAPVPEPSVLLLLGTALGGTLLRRRLV